jgi:hypothetical protein
MLDTEGWLGRDSPHMRTLPPLPPPSDPPSLANWGDSSRSGHRVNSTTSSGELAGRRSRDHGAEVERRRIRPSARCAARPIHIPANGRIVGLTALLRTNRAPLHCVTPPGARPAPPPLVHHLKVQPELSRHAEPRPGSEARCTKKVHVCFRWERAVARICAFFEQPASTLPQSSCAG